MLMRDQILPFWEDEGLDRSTGLFHERFDQAGQPDRDCARRLMVQARQSYVYNSAHCDGTFKGRVDDAVRALDVAIAAFSDDRDLSRGLCFSITPNGDRILDHRRDSYAHAFTLLALSAVIKSTGEPRFYSHAETLFDFVRETLWDPLGGGVFGEALRKQGPRSQNPNMHMFEALLAMHEAWPERDFLHHASLIADLFDRQLFDRESGAIFEHYGDGWSSLPHGDPTLCYEPGHLFEWATLLAWFDRLAGTSHNDIISTLCNTGRAHGFDGELYIYDSITSSHQPLARSKRLWPHCEYVRSLSMPLGFTSEGIDNIDLAFDRLERGFLTKPFPQGWVDRLSPNNEHQIGAVPASSLYHLYSALGAAIDHMNSQLPQQS